MRAVADKAGVTRVTLYRHFASMDELFTACMTDWRALHPPPDLERWRAIPGFERRLRTALDELYGWYARNSKDLYPIYRDAAHTPESNQLARRQTNDRQADAILADFAVTGAGGKRLAAAIGHAVRFWTWHSLEVDQGCRRARLPHWPRDSSWRRDTRRAASLAWTRSAAVARERRGTARRRRANRSTALSRRRMRANWAGGRVASARRSRRVSISA